MSPTNHRRVRTNPALIRLVLADVESTPISEIARRHGVARKNIYRWIERRETLGPQWPSDEDIAAWEADDEANRDKRRAHAEWAYEYKKRVYLNRGAVQVPHLGYTRRLQALACLGWTTRDIGEHMGVSPSRVSHLMNGMWAFLYPSTAQAIVAVYDDLSMSVPVDRAPSRRGEVRVHARWKRQALARGWAPPLAWSNIDDPNEQPKGIRAGATSIRRLTILSPDDRECRRCGVRQSTGTNTSDVCRDCKSVERVAS